MFRRIFTKAGNFKRTFFAAQPQIKTTTPVLFATGFISTALIGNFLYKKYHVETRRRSFFRRDEAEKIIYSIIAVNAVVFGAWRLPAMRHFMSRHFLDSVDGGPHTYTFLFSQYLDCLHRPSHTHH
jgi:uncharacterized membrane protein YciS (DUF1049 family)